MIKKRGDAEYLEYMKRLSEDDSLFFTDTHAHIHFKPLIDEIDDILNKCESNKVKRIVTVGIDFDDSKNAVALAEKYEQIFAVAGIHPHDSGDFEMKNLCALEDMLSNKKVLAVGEIGLDYFRNHSPVPRQKEVFATLLDLAVATEKPVVIHNRDATDDCVDILNSIVNARENNGIIHCFNGDKNMLKWALDNGFYLSFAGPLTYSKAEELRDAIQYVPLDRLFVETDCPYLAPIPFRGKQNDPSLVVFTAKFAADILKVELSEFCDRLEKNFKELFKL
jgi:TatD DNase family protein